MRHFASGSIGHSLQFFSITYNELSPEPGDTGGILAWTNWKNFSHFGGIEAESHFGQVQYAFHSKTRGRATRLAKLCHASIVAHSPG